MDRAFSSERDDLLGFDNPPSPPALVPVRSRERSSRSRPSSFTSDASRHAGSYWSRNSAPVIIRANAPPYRPSSVSSPSIIPERERSLGRSVNVISPILSPPFPPTERYSRPVSPVRFRSRSRSRRRYYRDRLEDEGEDLLLRAQLDRELDYDRAFSHHYDYERPPSRPRRRSTRREIETLPRSPSPTLSESTFSQMRRSRLSRHLEDGGTPEMDLERREERRAERREREKLLAKERELEEVYAQQSELLRQLKSKVEASRVLEANTKANNVEPSERSEAEGAERRSVRFNVSSDEVDNHDDSKTINAQDDVVSASPTLQNNQTIIERDVESLRKQIEQLKANKIALDHQTIPNERDLDDEESRRSRREGDYERQPHVEDRRRQLRDEAEIAQLEREQILLRQLDQLKREFRQKDTGIVSANEAGTSEREDQETLKKDEIFENRVRGKFLAAGYTEEEAQRILSSKKDSTTNASPEDMDESKKRHVKVHRKYLLPDTLDIYHLPWEWAKSDSNYIIIKKFVDRDLMDQLFQHTRDIKDRQAAASREISVSDDRDTLYIVRKKTDPSRSRRSLYL